MSFLLVKMFCSSDTMLCEQFRAAELSFSGSAGQEEAHDRSEMGKSLSERFVVRR
jgi:hypothetical protein